MVNFRDTLVIFFDTMVNGHDTLVFSDDTLVFSDDTLVFSVKSVLFFQKIRAKMICKLRNGKKSKKEGGIMKKVVLGVFVLLTIIFVSCNNIANDDLRENITKKDSVEEIAQKYVKYKNIWVNFEKGRSASDDFKGNISRFFIL